jgi:NOL1/NOP2/sun family putative RNA methylase
MRKNYEPKPLFLERMKELLPDEQDFESYLEILKKEPVRSFRCNTLKISVEELKKRLENKNWRINQPFKNFPEIMIVEGKSVSDKNGVNDDTKLLGGGGRGFGGGNKIMDLAPGELGRALEHLLGYYYIQELASMLPVLVLNPKEDERVLDLCASPGSKTTQMAARMNNTGLIIANEVKFGRIKILSANTERCGVMNMLITKRDGIALCKRFKEENLLFEKILLDAPCSGEGTIRSTPKTLEMWNIKTIENLSKLQKSLIASAIEILKPNGELVYSTCTHAPEENEEVIDFALKNFNVKIEKANLPVKARQGITNWKEKSYSQDVKFSCRIYPQDANTEGFFIAKIRKLK